MDEENATQGPNTTRSGKSLWSRPRRRWLLGIPLGGFLMFAVGVASWITFDTVVAVTNSEAFCTQACHSMREFIVPEWKASTHYSNRTGVRVTCSDCHVPKAFGPKMLAKVIAAKDLYHEIIGTVRTRQDFDMWRATFAIRVWDKMRATDSRECRNCHDVASMDNAKQTRFQHAAVLVLGRTCIDCHKGLTHELPDLGT